MPDGEKLGDGYIEVHYDVNEQELNRARSEIEDAQRFMYEYQRDGDEEAAKVREKLDRDVAKSREEIAVRANKAVLDATAKQDAAGAKARLDLEKSVAKAKEDLARRANKAVEEEEKKSKSEAAKEALKKAKEEALELEKMRRDVARTAEAERNRNRVSELSRTLKESQKIYDDFSAQWVKSQAATDRLAGNNEEFVHSEVQRAKILSTVKGATARKDIETRLSQQAGKDSGNAFADAISFLPGRTENTIVKAFSNPYVAVAVAAAAVMIGNVFTSALEAVVGLADIGGGIALAIMSSNELKDMGKSLGHQVFSGLEDAAGVLIPVIRDALNTLSSAAGPIIARIKESFVNLAPTIPALTKGIAMVGENLSQLFAGVSKNLVPVINVFGNEMLPKITQSLQDFFVNLSKDKESLIVGMRTLTGIIQFAILSLEYLLHWWQVLTDVMVNSVSFALKTVGMAFKDLAHVSIPGLSGKLGDLGDQFIAAGTDVHNFGDSTEYAGTQLGKSSGAAQNNADAMRKQAGAAQYAAEKNAVLGVNTDQLTTKHQAAAVANENLRKKVDEVTAAVQHQSDAVHAQIDADQDWNTKLLDLKDALQKNGATLDIHTRAGLANRDALEAAAASSRNLWEEDVASGVPVSEATRRAKDRTDALLKQFGQTGDLKDMTQQLIDKYGAIPQDVNTVLQLQGYDTVNARLQDLKVQQYALQENIPINQAMGIVRDEAKGLNKAEGGPIFGPGGPTDDMIPARLSNGEFVLTAEKTKKHWDLINAIHNDQIMTIPGFAGGGVVQNWPFKVDVSKTKIPEIFFGGGLGSASGQSVDVIAAIARIFQADAHVTSGYRPGEMLANGPSWHASGEAADLVSGDMDGLAQAFYSRLSAAILEEIHADGARHWGIKNGQKPYEMGETLWGQHNDHVHIAMHRNAAESALAWLRGGGKGTFAGDLGSAGGGSAPTNSLQSYARSLFNQYGWGAGQLGPLAALWNRESNWNPNAVNPSSGAYGIPQALGHGHPYNLGDAPAQIRWGLGYIASTYGSPAAAWSHEQSVGWYDNGGYLQPGWNLAYNGLGTPEPVLTPDQYNSHGGDTTVVISSKDGWLENAIDVRIEKSNQKVIRTLRAGPGRK